LGILNFELRIINCRGEELWCEFYTAKVRQIFEGLLKGGFQGELF
jgi:hypothetical protein